MNAEKKLFRSRLLAIVLPVAAQNLLTALVSASDAVMTGALSQTALSAVSLAGQVQFVLSLFFAAVTIGATVLAAQYWGKEDTASVEEVLGIALSCSLPIAAVFFLAALLVPGSLMRIFTNDADLIETGIPYLRLVSFSYLFMGFSQVYLCIMKNSGRTGRSTVYGSAAPVLNVLLNALLIFGLAGFPRMGVAGAALATSLSRAAELLLTVWENTKKDVVRFRPRRLFNRAQRLRPDYIRYTTPVLANELVWGCGFTMFSVIMGHLGSDAVAANSFASIVKNIIACVCYGIATGSGILVGNALGSGDLTLARRYGRWLCLTAITVGLLSGALILAAVPLVPFITGSLTPAAQGYLRGMLCLCAVYMVGKSINCSVISGIFCAGGDTKFGFLCDAVTMWAVVVPLGALAAFVWKLPVIAVYAILNMDEMVKLPAVYRHYKKEKWVRNLTDQKEETK